MSAVQAGKARDRDDDSARHFVNALSVKISLSSIRFDLAALGSEGERLDRVWRFVTTPSRIHSFHARLGRAIDSYRAQFGAISSPDADDGSESGDDDG